MTIEQAIYLQITGNPTVSGLVSNRVTPEWRREGTTLPAVIYSVDSRDPITTLTGVSTLEQFNVSVTSIAATMAAARGLADEVRIACVKGVFPWTTHEGTSVKWVRLTSEDVERLNDEEGTDDGPRAVTQQYTLWATGG
jgi:hypothetical protein